METKRIYANRVTMSSSAMDFYFKLTQHVPVTDVNGGFIGEEQVDEVGVFMSPAHAKAFYTLLGEQLTQFEKNFGVIKLQEVTIEEKK